MNRIFLFLFAVSLIGISEMTAQSITIDANYIINVGQATSSGVYTINIDNANFSNEQKAKQVFNFFAEHPALNFDLNYNENQVIMKVRSLSSVSNGTIDLNYLNGVLRRRSMAYQRLF